jgi:hypothetical protein
VTDEEIVVLGRNTYVASRDDLYCKFGITAEAAQLFETELGSLLLAAQGAKKGWHVQPDPERGRKLLDEIDRHTLGQALSSVKSVVKIDDYSINSFAGALKARNRLMHGFFERHAFKIQTDEGRDEMIADLELLHAELFRAYQLASAMTHIALEFILEAKKDQIREA